MRLLFNALGFQTAWWACIAGVGHDLEIPALLYGGVLAGLHLCWVPRPWQEIQLACFALVLGLVLDSALQALSVIEFYGWALGPLSPFWLWMLWFLFALTLNSSLGFLQRQPLWLSALAGFVFGPVTYYAGAKLGAASFDASLVHVLALAVAWMLAMPVLVILAKEFFTPSEGLT
jgi:Protein of unknown function (DUF2878)